MIKLEENNIYFYFNKSKLIENFNNFSVLGDVYYPLKTNSNGDVIKTLHSLMKKEENGFLISSIYHFETLQRENINPLKMCFINVLAEDDTVKYLYNNGVRFFTFDNLNSVINFSKYADLSKVKIAIRLSTTQVFNDNIADDEWEWYIGQIFSRLIKNVHKSNIKNLVEIAPGFRYKIAYALKDLGFQGNLYVIDTNTEVLEYINEKYNSILPNAKIICINKSFENAFEDIPNEFDLLLSNHCIDDMIIAEYMQNYYNKNLNNENFRDMLTQAWVELGKEPTKINEISSKVFSIFKNFFLNKRISTIIMSQYKSNLYFKDEFREMDEITESCFNRIKQLIAMDNEYVNKILDFYPFGDDERYRGKYLLDNTQNAKNWIVGKCKE